MYGGCGVGDIGDVPSAGASVERIAQQAQTVLSRTTEATPNKQG
jgi:hypothetical protein